MKIFAIGKNYVNNPIIYIFSSIIAFASKFIIFEPGDLFFSETRTMSTGKIEKGDHLQVSIKGELLDVKMI